MLHLIVDQLNPLRIHWWLAVAILVSGTGCALKPQTVRSTCANGCSSESCAKCDNDSLLSESDDTTRPLPRILVPQKYWIEFPSGDLRFDAWVLPNWRSESENEAEASDPNSPMHAESLVADEALCRAFNESPIGNATRAQRDRFRTCSADGCTKSEVDELLRLTELRERQLAAGQAAELLVTIARLQCQQALLLETREDLLASLDTLADLEELNDAPIDKSPLESRLIDLDVEQATIDASEVKTQATLRQIMGLHPRDSTLLHVRSLKDWIAIEPGEDLVQLAMRERPDLRATRQLALIDRRGLDVDLAAPLAAIHPVLAIRLIARSDQNPLLDALFGSDANSPECEPQMAGNEVIVEQSKLITTEVVTHEAEIIRLQKQVLAEVRRVEYWEANLQRLDQQSQIKSIDPATWFRSKLSIAESKSRLVNAMCDLELAYARLYTSLGLIGRDCSVGVGEKPGVE